MKHFLNDELLAPNVFTMPVDEAVVAEFAELAQKTELGSEYCVRRPDWKSDIRWISADTVEGFETFQSAFDRIDIARNTRDYLDVKSDVRLYAGFLHTRSQCSEPTFHVDWTLTNNEAFTLLTPICGLGSGRTLLYKTLAGETAEYSYRLGEAIVFGDHFVHSTPPGIFDPPFTLLVFNFGTDKMEHWDKIRRTTGSQCHLIRRPDGQFSTSEGSTPEELDKSPNIQETPTPAQHREYQSVPTQLYRRAVELLEADVNDELVALDPTQGNCFGLNAVAKDVWRKLESPRTFNDLRSELLDDYDVTEEECTRELEELLAEMTANGLIKAEPESGTAGR